MIDVILYLQHANWPPRIQASVCLFMHGFISHGFARIFYTSSLAASGMLHPPLIPNLVSAAIVLRLSSPCNLFSPGDDFILLSLFLYLSLPISFCLSFLLSSPLNHFLKIRGRKWTGVTRCRIKEKKKKKSSTRNDASGPWTVLSHAPPTQLDPMLSLWILEKDAKKVLSVLQEVNSECQMISDKRHEQSRKRETRSVDWSK